MKSYSLLTGYKGRGLLIRVDSRTDEAIYYRGGYDSCYFTSEYKDLKVKKVLLTGKERRSRLWKRIRKPLKGILYATLLTIAILLTVAILLAFITFVAPLVSL